MVLFADFIKIQKEEPLDLPSKPPRNRTWRGNIIAPFAGNNILALYHCHDNHSIRRAPKSKYFVQVLHNEVTVSLPVSALFYIFFEYYSMQ